jgi:putative ABC transport system permease protein
LVCAAIGIALGLAGAAAGTRYLQAMLYGVTPLDEWTFAALAVAFAAVAALASYLPARRASHLEPMVHCGSNRAAGQPRPSAKVFSHGRA